MVTLQRIFFLAMLLIALPGHAASLQATVDRNTISENDTVQLTLTLRDYDGPINPDLTILEGLFDLLGTHQSSQMSIVNGRIDASKQVQITLAPKQAGTLVIPAIEIGQLQSQPIPLQVVKANRSQTDQIGELKLEAEVDITAPYVQQQVILTVRLIHSINLSEGSLPDPEISGVEIYKLGDDKSYQTQQNGRRLGVIERRYAILPQQSGAIEIPSILFRGRSQARSQGGFGGLFGNPFNQGRQLQTRSEAITLEVKQHPQHNSGIPWLPASAVTLLAEWSTQQSQFRVGEPITRTLTLQAHGLSANQLPELSLPTQGNFKVYPDQPQLTTDTTSQGVLGTRIEKYAVVPTQTGSITLPAINLTWWNSEQNALEVIKIPAETIEVLAATQVSSTSALLPSSSQQTVTTTATDKTALWPWQIAVLLLSLAWLSTLGLLWCQMKRRTEHKAPKSLCSRPEKPSLKAIQHACQANDPNRTRDALLLWSKQRWPQHTPISLIDLAEQLDEPSAQQQLLELDGLLYREHQHWDGAKCWNIISPSLKGDTNTPDIKATQALPGLYD